LLYSAFGTILRALFDSGLSPSSLIPYLCLGIFIFFKQKVSMLKDSCEDKTEWLFEELLVDTWNLWITRYLI
ncbi:hypothetical protein PSZ91_23545, partial [Shigella sonnei]|nr:hypothetical protein [Shigella sonnei]